MLIISKFKDYYDGVVGTMGVDKTIVYERQTQEFDKWDDIPDEFKYNSLFRKRGDLHIGNAPTIKRDTDSVRDYERTNYFILGFCGKIYVGWWLWYKTNENGLYSDSWERDIVYDYGVIKKIINHRHSFFSSINDDVKRIQSYDKVDIFRKYHTPTFVYFYNDGYRHYNNEKFIVNPVLKDFEFYKVFDTFTTFQEIQMFLGGVLGSGENEMVEISNKNKILKHGFDYKWSFRKEPTKKKKK